MSQNVIPSDQQASDLDLIASLSTLNKKAIVRPDNPPAGVAGFLFDIVGDETVMLTSEITDHYVEDNTAIQDHVALAPEQITLKGTVGELVIGSELPPAPQPPSNPLPICTPMMPVQTPGSLLAQFKNITLGTISQAASVSLAGVNPAAALRGAIQGAGTQVVANLQNKIASVADSAVRSLSIPSSVTALLTPGVPLPLNAQTAVNILQTLIPKKAAAVVNAIKTSTSAASSLLLTSATTSPTDTVNSLHEAYVAKQPTPPNQTRQSAAFLYFYNLWKSRQPFSVETAWGIWTNMAILSCRVDQTEESKDASSFTITFKKIRVAQDVTVKVGQLAGRNAMQATANQPTQNGTAGQKDATPQQEESWLFQWAGALPNITIPLIPGT